MIANRAQASMVNPPQLAAAKPISGGIAPGTAPIVVEAGDRCLSGGLDGRINPLGEQSETRRQPVAAQTES
jgi:hypothetical protein